MAYCGSEGDAFRVVAMHGAPPPVVEERRREPGVPPRPWDRARTRRSRTKQTVQIADLRDEPAYIGRLIRRSGRWWMSAAAGHCWWCRCSRTTSSSALSPSTARRCGHSPTSRSSWSPTSPPRPSSPSRTRDCSTSCASAPTISEAAATDRHCRRAQGHQPIDVRPPAGVQGAGQLGRPPLSRRRRPMSRCCKESNFQYQAAYGLRARIYGVYAIPSLEDRSRHP